jgi:Deoxyribonuclease NucA/NucB
VRRALAIALAATCLAGCETVEAPAARSPEPTPHVSTRDCTRPSRVASIGFSATKYPHIRHHFQQALRRGWPRVLTLHRPGADERRDELLEGVPTREGYDRDEYPPAVGRRRAPADVAYVPSSENRSHGAVLGIKLRRFCEGTRFRYVFY